MSVPEPRAWCKLDVNAWPMAVEMLTASGQAWPEALMLQDVRWMLDQVEMGRLARIPGRPTLRKRWNVSDRTVRGLLQSLGNVQPVSSLCPAPVQPVSSPEKVEPEQSGRNVQPVSSPCPARVQPMSTGVSDRTQNTEHRTQTPPPPSSGDGSSPLLRRHAALSQPAPEPSAAKQWGHLADAYGALPGCIRPKARKKGNGIALDKLLDHHGLDLAKLVVRWWAYGDGKAEYLRDNRHKLATLARDVHLDKYAEDATEWKARGSPGDPSVAPVARAPRISIDEQVARDVARAKQQTPRYKRQRRT